jgi:hypothetical protein
MSGDDATTRRVMEEQVKLQSTRDALTKFLRVKKTTGDTDLAQCEKDKDKAAEAAEAAKTEATKTAQEATDLATKTAQEATDLATNKAEEAKVEATKIAREATELATKNAEEAKVEATTKCDTEKSALETKAELEAKKRAEEILKLQDKLIEELAKETEFLDSLMR